MQIRFHTCENGHKWCTKVEQSKDTQNLSGEKTPWCPECNKRAMISTSIFKVTEAEYKNGIK